jgi:hypothetical protein
MFVFNLVLAGNKIRNDFIYRPVLHRAAFLPVSLLVRKVMPRLRGFKRRHVEDDIKSDRKGVWHEDMAWFYVAQNRV